MAHGESMTEFAEILLHAREEWRDWLAEHHAAGDVGIQ